MDGSTPLSLASWSSPCKVNFSCDVHPGVDSSLPLFHEDHFVIMGVMVLYCFLMGGFGFSPWILAPSELLRSSTEFCVLKYDAFRLRLKQTININVQGYSLKLPARFIPISFPGLTGFGEEVDFL